MLFHCLCSALLLPASSLVAPDTSSGHLQNVNYELHKLTFFTVLHNQAKPVACVDERINITADILMINFTHHLLLLQRCLHVIAVLKRDFFQSVYVVVVYIKLEYYVLVREALALENSSANVVLTLTEDSINNTEAALAKSGYNFIVAINLFQLVICFTCLYSDLLVDF